MDANIRDSHAEDETYPEVTADIKPLPDTTQGPNDSFFKNLNAWHGITALSLFLALVVTVGLDYINTHKGTEVPINTYVNGVCVKTQYWHVPDRYLDHHNFEQQVAEAKADGAADLRRTETCKVHIVR